MPLGDEYSEYHAMLANPSGMNPRLTFPLKAAMHSGGLILVRTWVPLLHGLANDLEAIASRRGNDRSAMFDVATRIRMLNQRMHRRSRERDVVR